MESLQQSQDIPEDRKSANEAIRQAARAAVHMRLWAYGGPQAKLSDLNWHDDSPVAELVQAIIHEAQGTIVEEQSSSASACFADPLQALSAAKALQIRLLTLHREPPQCQVVAAVRVDETTKAAVLLEEANSAQILVSEGIYDLAKNIPGFVFNSKPPSDPGETGTSETIYELRWTDESTYGHLRKTSQVENEVPRQRRYTIQSELGRGCMGIVYKAYDELIGRQVALKTIAVNRSFPNRNELIERLKQEAKAAGNLDHPNIITIFDVGQEEDFLYLSMQLIEGKTLMALLTDNALPPLPVLLTYVDQILSAVGFAHQRGVIHRDLKQANFMLTSQGAIKVLDFGIAKIEDASLTQSGMIVGTPTYMAPEQARAKKIDQRSDIFSLGSVFYELFTREKPFKGDVTTVLYKLIHEDAVPPSVINPALPSGIDAIIRKALAKNPADRFQTCEEMREAFREQAALLQNSDRVQRPVLVSSAPVKQEPRPVTVNDLLAEVKPRRSHRALWLALTTGILVAVAGTGLWIFNAKVRTGSFPPAVEKLLTAVRGSKKQPAANDASNNSGQQTALPSPAATSNAAQPVSENPGSAASTDAASPSSTPANNENVAGAASQPAIPVTNASETPNSHSGSDAAPGSTAATQPASSDNKTAASTAEPDPFKPRTRNVKSSSPAAGSANLQIEGLTRRDVPLLLGKAEEAAGRGDYSLARYEYNIILRLDRQNAAAKAGLRRVIATELEQHQH